jgi:hypothetical protein
MPRVFNHPKSQRLLLLFSEFMNSKKVVFKEYKRVTG